MFKYNCCDLVSFFFDWKQIVYRILLINGFCNDLF